MGAGKGKNRRAQSASQAGQRSAYDPISPDEYDYFERTREFSEINLPERDKLLQKNNHYGTDQNPYGTDSIMSPYTDLIEKEYIYKNINKMKPELKEKHLNEILSNSTNLEANYQLRKKLQKGLKEEVIRTERERQKAEEERKRTEEEKKRTRQARIEAALAEGVEEAGKTTF
jgi:hypothetical protein